MELDSDDDEVFRKELIVISSDEEEIIISDSESNSSSMLSSRAPATVSLRGEKPELVKPLSNANTAHEEGVQHLEDCRTSTSFQGSARDNHEPQVCSRHSELPDNQVHSDSSRVESTYSNKSSVKIQRKLNISSVTPERVGQFVPLGSLLSKERTPSSFEPSSFTLHTPESSDPVTRTDSVITPPCKKVKSTDNSNNSSAAVEHAHQFYHPAAITPAELRLADSPEGAMLDTSTLSSIRKVFRKRKLLSVKGDYIRTIAADQSSVDFRVKTEAHSPQNDDNAFVPTSILPEIDDNPSPSSIPGATHHSRSFSDSVLPVKEELKSSVKLVRASESDAPRRKRKLCKSMDSDSEVPGPSEASSEMTLLYIDCDFVASHTQENSPLRFSFITQLQTEGYALPHSMILDFVQEMMAAKSTAISNTICKILWSDSECFSCSTNKKLLNDLFTVIIDSLMANKYSCVKNINMALQYFINILCVNWRNTTNESDSYVATFLETKVRQLLSELRRYYDKPVEVFCPHVAATLQQLTCLSLAVMHEPLRLSEFSQQVYDEVFSSLNSDKQEVFLNNLPSPYLVARLSATLLAAKYVPTECSDLLLLAQNEITSDWVGKFLMVCNPYDCDGTIALRHVLWLLTKLLTSYLQHKHGMILSSPVIVFHPLALLEMFDLSYCNDLLEEFMDRLIPDEVLYITCLFTPEVLHYFKLISTLLGGKTLTEPKQSNFY